MAETYDEKLIGHISEWDIQNFRVCYDDQVIFLCGSVVHPKEQEQISMRGHFFHYFCEHNPELSEKIILAENFKQYLQNEYYPDLITFEHDVANLSSLIVIFLESSGSIAELGVFCNMAEINKKLLIFVPADEVEGDRKESFISLGPLLYLQKSINKNSCKIYPKPNAIDDYSDHLEFMAEDLIDIIPKQGNDYSFDKNSSGHIAFLISRIVHLAMPVRLKEIAACLKTIGIDNFTITELERTLFLLETLKFIKTYYYGTSKYYYTMQSRQNIKLGKNKKGTTIDESRIFTDISLYINDEKRNSDKKRRLALKGIMGKADEHN